MALANKPHTLTFYTLTEVPDGTTKIVGVPEEGAGEEVTGQLTPVGSEQTFNAIGMELRNPHLFLCDLSAVASVPIKANIAATGEGKTFVVRGRPREWNAIPAQSFAEVYLEETEYRS